MPINVTVTSAGQIGSVTATSDTTQYWSNQSKEWAEKSEASAKKSEQAKDEVIAQKDVVIGEVTAEGEKQKGILETTSQSYIDEAKNWANKLGDTVDGVEYSAKHYAELTADRAETAITDINNTKDTVITDIQTEGTTQVNNIKQTGFYMEDGKLYYTDEVGNVKEFPADSIPLGFSTYQGDGVQPSAAWLASNGQWNSGDMYLTFYNHYVPLIGQKFAVGYVRNHTETYDDYDLVINQDDMTFRLPLLDGSENLPSNKRIDWTSYLTTSEVNLPKAPANGFISMNSGSNTSVGYLFNVTANIQSSSGQTTKQDYRRSFVPVTRGDLVHVYQDTYNDTQQLYFMYAKGNGTLYFKVGNAVQNLELLNVGEVMNTLATKTDKAQAANAAMPSDKYIDLTLGASGTMYTAPADGWVNLAKRSGIPNAYIHFYTPFIQMERFSVNAADLLSVCIPVKAGDVFVVNYSITGKTENFVFIYAEGAK